MLITKADGTTQQFDPTKLERSLRRAGARNGDVASVLAKVEERLTPGVTTREIYASAFDILKHLGGPIATRYTLRAAIQELGPTGFPFEDYIARLFQYEGYETLVRQNLQGACALHEIDVVGRRGDKVFIGEVKFHKDPGYKSDLQTALYSYARFLDVLDSKVCAEDICGINTLKIITNTKFTQAMLEYSLCKGIELHSWGFPRGDASLEALVEKYQMYPITILASLSEHHKILLMQRGIVLCKDLIEKRTSLPEYKIPEKIIAAAVAEAEALFAQQIP
ncbi:hypothetical protein A3C89_00605 [Candidatus Kaiserbacteria bacterium RIFCSPHIGHO2_02_FULL_50_50]|uniref:ATP-cone domain-containing protein n=1 Tax=Candidatus Kaiserbacteria bacterium RIFCSPHIGHO2_02_FULL_50_50 TaxID=1798492 RepID=A0A1F6DFS7_9BACT|nr:MAG: hypothetical protein A3C89_00605 [Candidatus Kaiserbacteria bacterium RIFCSPHIGHO2_02_FULL_50_50]OGG88854.1 MAG: hypothetical protein A3G62_03045 [Candidatus Kaiserbacteria bacterium RIFCSPLOWO2_12_FULL_50_10]